MSLPVQGASVQERVSVQGSLSRRFLSKQSKTPLYRKEWMVCILLECILVKYYIYYLHLRTENHYIVWTRFGGFVATKVFYRCSTWVHLKSILPQNGHQSVGGGGKMATSPFWGKTATSLFWGNTDWWLFYPFYPQNGFHPRPVCFTLKMEFLRQNFQLPTTFFASQRSFLRKTNNWYLGVARWKRTRYVPFIRGFYSEKVQWRSHWFQSHNWVDRREYVII